MLALNEALAIYVIAITIVTEITIVIKYFTSRESNIPDFYSYRYISKFKKKKENE